LIASIKLLVLKRYHDGHLSSPSSSPAQSLEVIFDQLIANKYSTYFYFISSKYFRFLGHPVAGNTDGFVQGIINDMERLYAIKQERSHSLNT
jgi:hypothetical protein